MPLNDRLSIKANGVVKSSGLRSFGNTLRFGSGAPRPDQRLMLSPDQIKDTYKPQQTQHPPLRARHSGQVRGGAWDLARAPLHQSRKYRACAQHFRDGVPWKETGIYDLLAERIAKLGEADQCRTHADIVARYDALDRLWEATCKGDGLLTAVTQVQHAKDGILIHIDRDGMPLFGNQGCHRLAIAKLGKIEQITVVLGRTHDNAIRKGLYARLLHRSGC